MNQKQSTRATIRKWYSELNFPHRYDERFQEILETYEIPETVTAATVDLSETDGAKNLLTFLYLCDELEERYRRQGISREILMDTLSDLVRWTNIWSDVKKELYLGEIHWLHHHFSGELFKLGRLQFCLEKSEFDVPEFGLHRGDCTVGVHIPASGPLLAEECRQSLALAREFFPKYFPEHRFSVFTCHSWLLGTSLSAFLPADSNILQFQTLFHIVEEEESDDVIKYVFPWDTRRPDLERCVPTSGLSRKVREAGMAGEKFYVGLGIIPR